MGLVIAEKSMPKEIRRENLIARIRPSIILFGQAPAEKNKTKGSKIYFSI